MGTKGTPTIRADIGDGWERKLTGRNRRTFTAPAEDPPMVEAATPTRDEALAEWADSPDRPSTNEPTAQRPIREDV